VTVGGLSMDFLALLATDRINDSITSGSRPFFPYEFPIAALSIAFCRMTLVSHVNEPMGLRWFFSGLLGILAYTGKSYELIIAVELFSYVIVFWILYIIPRQKYSPAQRLAVIAGGAILCMIVSHALTTGLWLRALRCMTPYFVVTIFKYLFPIDELREAITIMYKLSLEPKTLEAMLHHLLFVTAHIQVGTGYLGIHFLTMQQARRNLLVRLDVDEGVVANGDDTAASADNQGKPSNMMDRSKSFKKGAAGFSTWYFLSSVSPSTFCPSLTTLPFSLWSGVAVYDSDYSLWEPQ
jgi:hypothetical protein